VCSHLAGRTQRGPLGETASCPPGRDGTSLGSGRNRRGLVDPESGPVPLHCHSLTVSIDYQSPRQRKNPLASRGGTSSSSKTEPWPQTAPSIRGQEEGEIQVQPHGDSYFLSGKVAGKAVTFLLDSGCTTNLLSRRVFDTLSLRDKKGMRPYEGEHGTLADGSCIPFHGIIELTGRVRDQSIQETFFVSSLKKDAILGIPFLQQHGCHTDFSKSAMAMSRGGLACVDKFGRPLVGGVQVVRDCTIPGRSRATVHCKVNNSQISRLGVVKGAHDRI